MGFLPKESTSPQLERSFESVAGWGSMRWLSGAIPAMAGTDE
jgi:hypothetical protein